MSQQQQQGVKREHPDGSSGLPESDPRNLLALSLEEKTMMLACLIPCGECPYYSSLNGNIAEPCIRCNRNARDHGNLNDPESVERKFESMIQYAVKLDLQMQGNTYAPGTCILTLRQLLQPVKPIKVLANTPPFESPAIDEILRHFIRYAFSSTRAGVVDAVKDAGRKACALVMRMLDSPGFYHALTTLPVGDTSSVDRVVFRPFLERWQQYCHKVTLFLSMFSSFFFVLIHYWLVVRSDARARV